jgi:hypothetical protein
MNSSTVSNNLSQRSNKRQSIFTLAFFCLVIIALLTTSCTQGIFETPYGNKTLVIDTLQYHHSLFQDIRNKSIDVSGNQLDQNKVGNFDGLSSEFMIKFNNFTAFTALPDSVDFIINSVDAQLFIAGYWGSEATVSLDIAMIDNDSSLYWTNLSDPLESYDEIDGRTLAYTNISAPVDQEFISFPIDLATVQNWYSRPDSLYVNNGFTVKKTTDSEGLLAFYSTDYSADSLRPKLEVQCTLNDTNGVFIKDSTFYVYAGGDLQKAENTLSLDENLFYLSQGNIHRPYIEFDSLRQDTLLGPTDLLNQAILTLVIKDSLSYIESGDTLILGARLFKTDYWDIDSISYKYTTYSSIFTEISDTIKMDISQLLQYLISNPKEMHYEGLFFYTNNEYNDFNKILFDRSKTTLDIVYTKVKDE